MTRPSVTGTGSTRLWPAHGWQRWTLAAVVAVVLMLIVFRRPLADRVWPEASVEALQDRAHRALLHGRLTAADGTGARELYEAALAIDPDRSDARIGLMQVAQAALLQASHATSEGRYADAHRALQLAGSLSAPRGEYERIAAQLRSNEVSHAGIDRLLAQAVAARTAHRLDGAADAALPIYQRILSIQPDRTEALNGREDTLSDLLHQARTAIQHGDLLQAAQQVSAARGYDPGHADLPDAEAALSAALEQAHRRAQVQLHSGQLDAAATSFRILLKIDTGDAAAQRGLERVATLWARRAERAASDFDFEQATGALRQAQTLAPDLAAVHAAGQAIARARQARSAVARPAPSRRRVAQVQKLLAEAVAAEHRGDLLTPPGDSAFDKLRAARALAPDDRAVRIESARLLPIARECFERELRNNNLGRAGACLDARIVLDGDSRRIGHDKRRLAQRWLAVGSEWLGAGNARGAVEALEHARALDAQAPGIDEFSERLRTAGAH
jgi:tetratricopeptide (TPR) repeat protein